MKIVHINLLDQYNDTWSYQDNLLPRMHKRAGHDVTMIATCRIHCDDGTFGKVQPSEYVLPDGVKVIRVAQVKKYPVKKLQTLMSPYEIFDILQRIKPDMIMVHGLTARYANRDIIKYMKRVNPACTLVVDSHTCEINADIHTVKGLRGKGKVWFVNAMHRQLYPYAKKIYGITPACVDYAVNYYEAPAYKTELLPLGYDPDVLPWERREEARTEFRQKHHLQENDIVIIHGGKIIRRRKTPETIEAVAKLNDPKVKLVVFGGMDAEMRPKVEAAIEKNRDRVIYLGALSPEEYHQAYYAADLAVFPGGQSVLWQQAIGCGLPIVVGNDKKLDYLDRGGNACFLDDTSAEGIYKAFTEVLKPERLAKMKAAAQMEGREFFSYERIAQQIIESRENI